MHGLSVWDSPGVKLLAVASAAIGAVIAANQYFDVPMSALALVLFSVSVLYALLAIAGEHANNSGLLQLAREGYDELYFRSSHRGGWGGNFVVVLIEFFAPLIAFLFLLLPAVLVMVSGASLWDAISDPQAKTIEWSPTGIATALLISGVFLAVAFIVSSNAGRIIVGGSLFIAFLLVLVGVTAPMIGLTIKNLPRAAEEAKGAGEGDWSPRSDFTSNQSEVDDRIVYNGLTAQEVEVLLRIAQRGGGRVAAGRDGRDGRDGRNGRDGISGRDGIAGRDGISGRDGIAGRDGISGRDGIAGRDGVSGRDGVPGAAGRDGAPGRDGANAPGNVTIIQGHDNPALTEGVNQADEN